MDALDKMIADERAALAELQASVKTQQIKVDALIAAAAARPVIYKASPPLTLRIGGKGKPKGAISILWRKVFHSLFQLESRFTYKDIHRHYRLVTGSDVTDSAIRDRVRKFVEADYVTGTPDTGFTFTERSVAKFGLMKRSPNENGAASAAPDTDEVRASSIDSHPSLNLND